VTFSMGGIVDGWGASPERVAIWERRRTNALIELAALRRVITELPVSPQARDAFLEGFHDLKRSPASIVRLVIGSPYGFAWLRRAFRMIDDLRRGTAAPAGSPPSAGPPLGINDHLSVFPIFAIGAQLASHDPGDSRTIATVPLPSTIPGTARHIRPSPSHHARISVCGGALRVVHGQEIPLAQVLTPGSSIVVDNRDMVLGYCCDDRSVLETSAATTEAFRVLFTDALGVLGSVVPGAESEAALIYRVVAPSLLGSPVSFPSSSNSTVLGMSSFSVPPHPEILAEMIVHEMSHNLLFTVQDMDPLLDPASHGEGWLPEAYYSPWRDDPRPLNGILHAVFVFSRVANFWLALIGTVESRSLQDLAKRRLAALSIQLPLAWKSLKAQAVFTDAGARFHAAIGSTIHGIVQACASLGLDLVQPSYTEVASLKDGTGSARERQREHFAQFTQRYGHTLSQLDIEEALALS